MEGRCSGRNITYVSIVLWRVRGLIVYVDAGEDFIVLTGVRPLPWEAAQGSPEDPDKGQQNGFDFTANAAKDHFEVLPGAI